MWLDMASTSWWLRGASALAVLSRINNRRAQLQVGTCGPALSAAGP